MDGVGFSNAPLTSIAIAPADAPTGNQIGQPMADEVASPQLIVQGQVEQRQSLSFRAPEAAYGCPTRDPARGEA